MADEPAPTVMDEQDAMAFSDLSAFNPEPFPVIPPSEAPFKPPGPVNQQLLRQPLRPQQQPPQPAAPPGPGMPVAPGAPAQRPGVVQGVPAAQAVPTAAGVAPQALGAPGAAPGAAPGVGPMQRPPIDGAAGELAPGIPSSGIGTDTSPRNYEHLALGTGAPRDTGLVGQTENPEDDPARLNYDYDPDGSRHADGIPRTASGLYMLTDQNWREFAPRNGIDVVQYPSAASTAKLPNTRELQRKVAGDLFRARGWQPWVQFNPRLKQLVGYTGPMDPSAGGGGEQENLEGRMGSITGQIESMAGQMPQMIAAAERERQAANAEQQRIIESNNADFELTKRRYLAMSEMEAEQKRQEAEQLKSDTQKMDEWARQTPTRQAVYAASMHAMPLLAILTAIGGAATGAHGMVMLGALRGAVEGVNEGRENQFEDAMNKWKNGWEALKEHNTNEQKMYEKLAESYATRADGYLKAADMTRLLMKDQLDAQQLRIQSSYEALRAQNQTIEALAKTVDAMGKAAEWFGVSNVDPQTVEFYTHYYIQNPAQFKGLFPYRDPLSRAIQRAVALRVPQMLREMRISPEQAANIPALNRVVASNLTRAGDATQRLDTWLTRFQSQAEVVRHYMRGGVGGSPSEVWNRWIRAGKKGIEGDVQVNNLNNAVTVLAIEHGRVIQNSMGSAALTDQANRTAGKLLNPDFSAPMMEGVIEEMQMEIDNARNASTREYKLLWDQLQSGQGLWSPGSTPLKGPYDPGSVGFATGSQTPGTPITIRSKEEYDAWRNQPGVKEGTQFRFPGSNKVYKSHRDFPDTPAGGQ